MEKTDNQVDDLDCPAPWLDINPSILRNVTKLINDGLKCEQTINHSFGVDRPRT